MTEWLSVRTSFWRVFFLTMLGVFTVLVVRRFTMGLGAISNLSDAMPWGMWIGFDLLGGVALAAGGFTVTAVVYIFHLERFKPIVRPTLLTAFLGYLLVVAALLIDLGRPWNIWHPLIFWNPHSVMFEVGWCVMLYTTVLFLEFLPTVFERIGWRRPLKIWKHLTPVLVIAGVLLSTLHQSSLGTLYVIAPQKLHPLWYSPILPVLFFVSAIALGLAMVNVESQLSYRAFGERLELPLLADVARATAVVLLLYLLLRIEDLWVRGVLHLAFTFDKASLFFLAEIVLGGILPMVMLFTPWVRQRRLWLAATQLTVVLGMLFNRLNVAVTAFQLGTGATYTPSWMEFVVSLGLAAIGFALFGLAVRHLPVFPTGPVKETPTIGNPFVDLAR